MVGAELCRDCDDESCGAGAHIVAERIREHRAERRRRAIAKERCGIASAGYIALERRMNGRLPGFAGYCIDCKTTLKRAEMCVTADGRRPLCRRCFERDELKRKNPLITRTFPRGTMNELHDIDLSAAAKTTYPFERKPAPLRWKQHTLE